MNVKAAFPDPFAALRADIAELRELIVRALPSLRAPPRQRLTVTEAAALALRSEQTITSWCRHHGIGNKVSGRWLIDKSHLKALWIQLYGTSHLPSGLR